MCHVLAGFRCFLVLALVVLSLRSDAALGVEGMVTVPVVTGRGEHRPFALHPGWVSVYGVGESKGTNARIDAHGKFNIPEFRGPATLIVMFDRIETPPVIVPRWPVKPGHHDVAIPCEYACVPAGYPDVWKEKYMKRAHGFYQTFVANCTQLYGASLFDGPKITWWGNKVRVRVHEDSPLGPVIRLSNVHGEDLGDHVSAGHSDFGLPRMGWRHGDMPVVPGKKYAVRIGGYESHGGQHFDLDAFIRPDKGDGYGPGTAYQEKVVTDGDLCFLLFSNAHGQLVENHIRSEEWEIFIPKHPPVRQWGQTFVSHGKSLAGLSFWASNGRVEPSDCRIRILKDGPKGEQVGPTKTVVSCDSPDRPIIRYPDYPGPLPDHEAFYKLPSDLFQVAYGPDEVKLVPGQTYYVDITASEPLMMYADGEYYDHGHTYYDGKKIIDKTEANKSETFHSRRWTIAMNIVTYEHPGGVPNDYSKPRPGVGADGNLLVNGDAEMGDYSYWQIGSDPVIDPSTEIPEPANHGGQHRFGISVGWNTADMYQYQEVPGIEPGKTYEAGMWATHGDGTDEVAQLLWCDGKFGGEEHLLAQTPPEAVKTWTLYKGKPFKPTQSTVTIVIRYKHPKATNIASIHVDDVYLRCAE